MNIHIQTFGCTANRADSLKIQQLLAGHTFTDLDLAQVVVVNTCTVTQTTQQKVQKFIRSVSDSGKRVIVAGCLPAAQPETVNGFEQITPTTLDDIVQILGNNGGSELRPPVLDGVTGVVSISRGCVGRCSYCIVRQARGQLVSRSIPEIIQDVELLLSRGAREIQLTSQDCAAYGLDTGHRLPRLLEEVTALEGDHMIRVGMMNPFTLRDIVDDVVEAFQDPHIFRFLHLPVQSGSDRVLEHMCRQHTVDEFRSIVHQFRARFPHIILSTDFIVGYPTESEQDLKASIELLEELKPQKVNITRYSPRPDTPASLLKDMPEWKKKERSRELTIRHHQLNRELLENRTGMTVKVLTTETGKDSSTLGRDKYYNKIAIPEQLPLGQWYDVELTESRITYYMGKRIS